MAGQIGLFDKVKIEDPELVTTVRVEQQVGTFAQYIPSTFA